MRLRIETDGNVNSAWTLGDPDRTGKTLRYIVEAYEGEPLFCIRGRDLLAIPAQTAYLGFASALALKGPVIEAIGADITATQTWQAANPTLLKYPDRPTPGTIRTA